MGSARAPRGETRPSSPSHRAVARPGAPAGHPALASAAGRGRLGWGPRRGGRRASRFAAAAPHRPSPQPPPRRHSAPYGACRPCPSVKHAGRGERKAAGATGNPAAARGRSPRAGWQLPAEWKPRGARSPPGRLPV